MLVLFMAGLARWRHLTNCDHNNLVMLNCESPVSRALSMLNPATNAAKSKTKAYRCQWTAALTWRTRHVFKPLKHVLNSPLYHAFQHISTIVYLNHLWTWRSFVQRSFRQFEGITSDEPHVDVEFFHHAHNLILHSRFPHPNLRRNIQRKNEWRPLAHIRFHIGYCGLIHPNWWWCFTNFWKYNSVHLLVSISPIWRHHPPFSDTYFPHINEHIQILDGEGAPC